VKIGTAFGGSCVNPGRYLDLVRCTLAALCSVLFAGAAPAVSRAATVTVGSDLSAAVTVDNGCEAGSCTRTLLSLGGTEVRSPVDGVVVRWRAVGAGLVHLRLARRDAGGAWRAGPATPAVAFPAGAERGEWAARLPIAAGDFIGVGGGVGSGVFLAGHCDCPQFPGTATALFWLPLLTDGETRAPLARDGLEPLVNVDIETDADRDGFGDDTQDCAPADPAVHENCGATPQPGSSPASPQPGSSPASPSPSAPAPSAPGTGGGDPAPASPATPPAPGSRMPASPPAIAPATRPANAPRRSAARCRVPNLRGRTLAAARRALRARNCRIGVVTRVRARGVARGRVLSHRPRAGRVLPTGTRVNVRVRR
jgi:hypothetical protein